ncbi:MAG: hypothetical protein SNJ85_09080 [Cyanobacteriota bacterium]
MLHASPQVHLPDIVARLAASLGEPFQVQARVSGHRLLVRIDGDPLPEPDPLLERLAPTLEAIAAAYGQRWVEIFAFPATEGIPEWHRQWEGQVHLNPEGSLYRAKQGDVEAIRYLLNYLLRQEGIQARVHLNRKLGLLQINLQAVESPDPAWAKDFMRRILTRLELPFLHQLRLSGQKLGSFLPTWSQEFDLKQTSFWQAPPVRARVPWVQDPPGLDPGSEKDSEKDTEPQPTDASRPDLKAEPETLSEPVDGLGSTPQTHTDPPPP